MQQQFLIISYYFIIIIFFMLFVYFFKILKLFFRKFDELEAQIMLKTNEKLN